MIARRTVHLSIGSFQNFLTLSILVSSRFFQADSADDRKAMKFVWEHILEI